MHKKCMKKWGHLSYSARLFRRQAKNIRSIGTLRSSGWPLAPLGPMGKMIG
jgi:hypothetical protein